MISIERAFGLVNKKCKPLGGETIPIEQALGFVLAENVKTPGPLPPFDNSAMDGYALRSADTSRATASNPRTLTLIGSVYAGFVSNQKLRPGEACGIMTGAPVPPGANAVAQKEEVQPLTGKIVVDHPIAKDRHIRRRGGEISKGKLILSRGAIVDAGVIGCLASIGRSRVSVYKKPSVAVIATGDETVAPGTKLAPGQIYDSNSYMVSAALTQAGFTPGRVRHVRDHPTALRNAVSAALKSCDMLVVTGGISVGDHDYLRRVLERERVSEQFWRVKQKPGKPLYFGVKGKKVVFGLPGNPASVFTCFYMYVYHALRRMAGFSRGMPVMHLPLARAVQSDPYRWRMMKARIQKSPRLQVDPLGRQASHMISTLADTNSLVIIPAGKGRLKAGTLVETCLLPSVREVVI